MTKRKLITLFLVITFYTTQAQIEITPNNMIANFSGFVYSSQTLHAPETQTGFGVYSIGIPSWTPSFAIKEKFYLGGMLGLEIGAGFPKNNIALLFKLPLGFSAGYQINDESFIQLKYFLLSQTGTFLQGSSDDGWVYAASLRYKHFIFDVTKSLGGTTKNGFLKGRMTYDFIQVFPKYSFEFKNKPFWVGIRFESFKGSGSEPWSLDHASNTELLFGKIISW